MAGYIGTKAAVVTPGAERKKVFSITTTTSSLTGLAYTPGFVHVFHNGVRLVDGTDYTATNGTSLTLTTAAQNGDEVVVISYATFEVADAYTKAESDAEFLNQAEGDARYVNVTGDTMTGALAVNVAAASSTTDALVVQNSGVGSVGHTTGLRFRYVTAEPAAIRAVLTSTASGEGRLGLFTSSDGSGAGLVERLGVDSAGRVTMPSQPAFHAVLTNSASISSVGTDNAIPFNSAALNTGGHYNTSTYRFTAPVSGAYQLNWVLRLNSANNYFHPILRVNNGTWNGVVFHTITNTGATTFLNTGRSDVVYLNTGDFVSVHQQDSSITSGDYQPSQCSFSGFLIG